MSGPVTMIINNEYLQYRDRDKILYDSRWSLEELWNNLYGGKVMNLTKEQLIKDIEKCIRYNKAARQAEVVELCKDATRKSNDVLAKARNYIKSTDEYERGLNDAWEFMMTLTNTSYEERYNIFGCEMISTILENYTVSKAIKLYNEYLEEQKKKEEEAAKPVLGDVVEVISNRDGFVEKGIFLSECFDTITYIIADGGVVKASSNHFKFIKTGEHVDIQGMLDNINE